MFYLERDSIKQKIFEVYRDCDIHSFPIDCISILKHYNFRIITYQQVKEDNSELYYAISKYSKDAFRFRMSIYYNSLNTDKRIRFSLMHELGHYILGHTSETLENENEADMFASNIIAPRVAIQHFDVMTADELHDIFGLSYSASNRTLSDYKKWRQQEHGDPDYELRIWLYSPNFYRHREARLQNKEKELKRSNRAWKKINQKKCFYVSKYFKL